VNPQAVVSCSHEQSTTLNDDERTHPLRSRFSGKARPGIRRWSLFTLGGVHPDLGILARGGSDYGETASVTRSSDGLGAAYRLPGAGRASITLNEMLTIPIKSPIRNCLRCPNVLPPSGAAPPKSIPGRSHKVRQRVGSPYRRTKRSREATSPA